ERDSNRAHPPLLARVEVPVVVGVAPHATLRGASRISFSDRGHVVRIFEHARRPSKGGENWKDAQIVNAMFSTIRSPSACSPSTRTTPRARAWSAFHRPPASRANVRRSVVMRTVGDAGTSSIMPARPSGGTAIAAIIGGSPATSNTTVDPAGAAAFFPTT